MAKLTRSQAKYIEAKFEKEVYAYARKLKEWANVTTVIQAMVLHVLFREDGSSSSWSYTNTKMKIFNAESRNLMEELHESLLFCDGSLETAQQIINNFTNKLKEIK